VWSLVEELKRDRVVVLTTHSMEEADSLGDTIALMAGGAPQGHGHLHLPQGAVRVRQPNRASCWLVVGYYMVIICLIICI
jgi:ABC-type Na+ transport system ATPase subunit NatA